MHRLHIAAVAVALIAAPLFSFAQTSCPNPSRNLSFGSRGADVVQLQTFLISQNDLAPGNNTGYFGRLTQAAVQAYQRTHGIVSSGTPSTTGYGVAGPKTRKTLSNCAPGKNATSTDPTGYSQPGYSPGNSSATYAQASYSQGSYYSQSSHLPASPPPITGELQNANSSGLCLTSSILTQLQTTPCTGTDPTQTWTYDPNVGTIKDGNGLCLDLASGAGEAKGDKVVNHTCYGGPHQRWQWDTTLGTIKSSSGKCLDLSAGVAVLWDCYGGAHQKWVLSTAITPISCALSASPQTLAYGTAATLSWTSANATAASLDHSIGAVEASGSHGTLPLTSPTTYTLSVSGVGGTATCSTQVGISETPPPLTTVIDTSILNLPNLQPTTTQIVIDGQSYVTVSGLAISNPSGACITIRNSHNIRITGNEIADCGASGATGDAGLDVYDSKDITIDHNYFTNIGPNLLAVFGQRVTNVSVDHNQFYRTSGGVNFWSSSGISVAANRFQDMLPRSGNLSGFVQFVSASGPNNRIACNLGRNDPAVVPQSGDLINLYTSNGTVADPIQVYGNRLIGTGVNLNGDGLASVGIQTGDGSFSSYIKVYWNQLVNTGGGSIGVSGGNDIEVFSNRIFEGGRGGAYTGGLAAVNFYGAPASWNIPGAYCRNVNLHDNAVTMEANNQSRALVTDWPSLNNWPNCENVTAANNDLFATLDENIVSAPAPGCSE